MEYTIIGSEVNLAARLETAADIGGIMISAATCALVREQVRVGEGQDIEVKGFKRQIRAYRVTSA